MQCCMFLYETHSRAKRTFILIRSNWKETTLFKTTYFTKFCDVRQRASSGKLSFALTAYFLWIWVISSSTHRHIFIYFRSTLSWPTEKTSFILFILEWTNCKNTRKWDIFSKELPAGYIHFPDFSSVSICHASIDKINWWPNLPPQQSPPLHGIIIFPALFPY